MANENGKMNWNEVTIKKYNEILNLDCKTEFEEQLRGIGILKDLTFKEVRNLPLPTLQKYIQEVTELGLKEIPNKPVKEWNGLKISLNIKYMTAGQMMDYDSIRDEGKDLDNLHKFMAVLTNPKDLKEFEERSDLINNEMPVSVAYGCHVFFCKLWKDYEKRTKRYLKGKAKKISLRSIGGGLPLFTYSVMED